ncbi:MAG: hypothetical protein QW660_02995 [Candidatus Bathyarchaeia archaeon]
MRRETKRYIIRSKWCIHVYWVLLLWTVVLGYSMLFDNRFTVLVYPLTVILFMLLIQTIYICVYQVEG